MAEHNFERASCSISCAKSSIPHTGLRPHSFTHPPHSSHSFKSLGTHSFAHPPPPPPPHSLILVSRYICASPASLVSSLSVLRDIPWSVAAMGLGCDCRGGFCSCRFPAATRMARAEDRWLRFLKRQRQQRQRWLDAKRSDEPFSTCVCISGCNCPRTPLAKRRRLCDDPRSCFDMRCLCHL